MKGDITSYLGPVHSTVSFEKLGEALPQKTWEEIVFFYHTFKKPLKLKQEIKNAHEYLKMRIN